MRLVLLLEAIREEFGTSDRMFTSDLVARLIAREGEPWATIKRNGAALDGYYLRGMLRGVVARDRQRENARGPLRDRHYYARANFEPAWARYIPSRPKMIRRIRRIRRQVLKPQANSLNCIGAGSE